jgi:antitoxin component YwqK of YwqJK toxin-antitoxin module
MRKVFFIYCWLLAIPSVFAQRPDSVQVNGEWFFVYPLKAKLTPNADYLQVVGLTSTEFEQYRDWVQANDPRLKLEKDSLIKALRQSIIEDKILTFDQYEEESDGFNRKAVHTHHCFIKTTRKYSIRRRFRGAINPFRGSNTKSFSVRRNVNKHDLRRTLLKSPSSQHDVTNYSDYSIPPSEKNLPDGKYILYFDDYFSVDHWTKWQLNPQRVAAVFSLKNNLPEGTYRLSSYEGETLADGQFENGLRTGTWLINKKGAVTINYKEGWCFNRKYRASYYNRKDSLSFQYANDLLSGECVSYQSSYGNTYEKSWSGYYENGIPNGQWEYNKMFSGSHFKGAIRAIQEADYRPYAKYWAELSTPASDSIYTFPEFASSYNYRDLWNLKTAKCIENSGMQSILKSQGYPLTQFIQSQEFSGKEISYLFFDDRCELWSDNAKSVCVARFYRNKTQKVIVGSRYFNNGVLFDTCGFDEQGQLIYKQFDGTGKLYRTSFLDQNGNFVKTVFTTPKQQLFIDGYAVKESYSDGYYWEGDTVVASRRVFKLEWNEQRQLTFENTYDQVQEQFVERSFDENTGALLLTKLIPYTREAFTALDSGLTMDKNWHFSKTYNLRKRSFKIDSFKKEIVWGELTFVEENNQGLSRVALLVNGLPFTGEVEVNIRQSKYDSYQLKHDKLVVTLHDRSTYRRQFQLNFSRRVKSKLNSITYIGLNQCLPIFFQLKLNEKDNYAESKEGKTDLLSGRGKVQNGIPTGDWTFIDAKKTVTAQLTYSGESSTGWLFHSFFQSADDKEETEEYKTDPLKEQYVPSCKKNVWYVYEKTPIANRHEEGTSITYNHKGDTLAIARYKNGKLHGDQLYLFSDYDQSNQVRKFLIGTFNDGKPTGKQVLVEKRYNTAVGGGKLKMDTLAVVNYIDGKREGNARYKINYYMYSISFANDLPDSELIIKNPKKETTQRFTFNSGYVDQMQHFKENTLSYEYRLPATDSLKLDLYDLYTIDKISPKKDYLYDWVSNDFLTNSIKPEAVPKESTFTKFYPNGTIARSGNLIKEKKRGRWVYASVDQSVQYTIDYTNSIYVQNNDTFAIIGVQTNQGTDGKAMTQLLLEESDFYKCTSDEYYSIREYIIPSGQRENGITAFYYDNGATMSSGQLTNGLPDGLWQFYNQQGGLTRMGVYQNGKKIGRWLEGDLTTKAYLGDICLDESNPDLDVIISQLERGKKITVTIYRNGKSVSKQTYESSN